MTQIKFRIVLSVFLSSFVLCQNSWMREKSPPAQSPRPIHRHNVFFVDYIETPGGDSKLRGVFPLVARDKALEWKDGAWRLRQDLSGILDQDYVSGLTYYDSWADIETSEGQYSWSALEQIVSATGLRGKILNVGIAAAQYSPQWIYKQGIEQRAYYNFEENRFVLAPLPWDPTYLRLYFDMVGNLGRVLSSNSSLYATIKRIMIAGPTNDLGFEPIIVGNQQDQAYYIEKGYPDKFVAAWKKAIDTYAEKIPVNIELNLAWHFGMEGHWNNRYSKELADYVYNKQLYTRTNLMSLMLKGFAWWNYGRQFPHGLERRKEKEMLLMFQKEQDRGFHIGLQMAMKDTATRDRFGNYGQALRNAIEMNCVWIEPWVEDIIDSYAGSATQKRRIQLLQWASAELKKIETEWRSSLE